MKYKENDDQMRTNPLPRLGEEESSATAAARPPRGQYDFVDTIEAGQGLIRSPNHNAQTIARAADRTKDVRRRESGYFYTKLHDAQTDRRDIKLEIDVVKGQKTTYEIELREVRQAYLSFEAQNRALLVRLETLKTYVSHMEWKRQTVDDHTIAHKMHTRALQKNSTHTQDDGSQSSGGGLRSPVQPARVCSYADLMKCQPLNFKITEGVVGLSQWLERMESVFHISDCTDDNQVKFATCTLLGASLTWWNGHMRTLGHDVAYAMTWETLEKKFTNKYYPKGEIKKIEIELWNLKVRGNDVAAYTQRFQELGLMCTKFLADETKKINKYIDRLTDNIHGNVMSARPKTLDDAIEQCVPKCGNCKRYSHTTSDYRVNTNNNKNQKAGACYECGNTGHIKKNSLKLKNHRNCNGNGVAQGRAYDLGGRHASPDSNVITGMFLLNNRYATILFDTGADRSFVSTTFSALINITPTTLENNYDQELADGKIIGVNFIIRGCTLNFKNHPFNIDLMPFPLDSFDVIIGMDWLTKYHEVINYDKKTEAKDKSERKQLKYVSIVRDFPEVFSEELLGIPPAQQVEYQINLVPGAAPVAQALYRLNKEEHEGYLKLILGLLKKEELYAKFSKCEFWIPKVQFLRHVIDNKGIHVDPAKIESIKDWASPKKVRDAQLTGPAIIHETIEKIDQIKSRIQAAHGRQKSYANIRRKPLDFEVGNRVMLKVSPWKGVVHFRKRGKLNPREVAFSSLRLDGTLNEVLSLPGNVRINLSRNNHISSPRPHRRQVPRLKP
nr:hypothetical protein [Tanacetum cinerariifolium]GEW74923.1 hypothetical protein [Tanacetum cinerariifolium]